MSAIVILGTSRKNGNTRKAVEAMINGRDIEVVDLQALNISAFNYENKHAMDDFLALAKKLQKYDRIVFASPVYWFSLSTQMKMFFDRLTDLLYWHKQIGKSYKGKQTFLISTGQEKVFPEGFEVPFDRSSAYFDMEYKGSCYCFIKKDGQLPSESADQAKQFGDRVFGAQ